jgi:transketolase
VSEVLGEHCPTPMARIGLKDTFGLSGKPGDLLKHYGLTAEDIRQAAYKVIARKGDQLSPSAMDLQAAGMTGRQG